MSKFSTSSVTAPTPLASTTTPDNTSTSTSNREILTAVSNDDEVSKFMPSVIFDSDGRRIKQKPAVQGSSSLDESQSMLDFANVMYIRTSQIIRMIFCSARSELRSSVSETMTEPDSSITELQSPMEAFNDGPEKTQLSRLDRFRKALEILHQGRLSPFDLFLEILDETQHEYIHYRSLLYKDENTKLFKIFDMVTSHPLGRPKFQEWLGRDAAFETVTDMVQEEMDRVRKADQLNSLTDITPSFIESSTVLDPSRRKLTPCLLRVLTAAAQTPLSRERNERKDPKMVSDCV